MRHFITLSFVLLAACGFEGEEGVPADDSDRTGDPGPEPGPGTGGGGGGGGSNVVCPGFTKIGASYYYRGTTSETWQQAQTECGQLVSGKSRLATFETAAEPTAVAAALQSTGSLWTGVVQKTKFGDGVRDSWVNLVAGASLPSGFPWARDEPNDGNGFYFEDGDEDYAVLLADGKLDDAAPSRPSPALCECTPE